MSDMSWGCLLTIPDRVLSAISSKMDDVTAELSLASHSSEPRAPKPSVPSEESGELVPAEPTGATVSIKPSVTFPQLHEISDLLSKIAQEKLTKVLVLPQVKAAPWHETLGAIPRRKLMHLEKGLAMAQGPLPFPADVWWLNPYKKVSTSPSISVRPDKTFREQEPVNVVASAHDNSVPQSLGQDLEVERVKKPRVATGARPKPKAGSLSTSVGAWRCTVIISGQSYRALLDTGADRSFCTPETVTRSGLNLRPGILEVSSAGGQVLKALGSVQTPLEVGTKRSTVCLWVTTLPKGIEVILGCDWLQEN